MENNILVSVIVATYNSSKTVIETLDSIKSQSYPNLEMIISDDASTDNSVELCEEWLSKNSGCFARTKLITVERNTGVCANLNRGVARSTGQWVKTIAADDILLPNCIQDYVRFGNEHLDASFITSFERDYQNTFAKENLIKAQKAGTGDLSIFEKSAETQLKVMAFNLFVNAPTIFFKRSLYDLVGGFDESYTYEDHPFYINVLEHGYKIYHIPKETVCYRVHDSTFNSNSRLFNPGFMKSARSFRKERCFKYYTWRQKLALWTRWKIEDAIDFLGLNKRNRITVFLYKKMIAFFVKLGGK